MAIWRARIMRPARALFGGSLTTRSKAQAAVVAGLVVGLGLLIGPTCAAPEPPGSTPGAGVAAPSAADPDSAGEDARSSESAQLDLVLANTGAKVETTACGHASSTIGTASALTLHGDAEPALWITAAHVIIGASTVAVEGVPVVVVAFDVTSDLALLAPVGSDSPAVTGRSRLVTPIVSPSALVDRAVGAHEPERIAPEPEPTPAPQVAVATARGSVLGELLEHKRFRVADVGASTVSLREGLVISADLEPGDSGAAVWSGQYLAGFVFSATRGERDRVFVVAAAAANALVETLPGGEWICDHATSGLVAGDR